MEWAEQIKAVFHQPFVRGMLLGAFGGFVAGAAATLLLAEYRIQEVNLPVIGFSRPDHTQADFDELREQLQAAVARAEKLATDLNGRPEAAVVEAQIRDLNTQIANLEQAQSDAAALMGEKDDQIGHLEKQVADLKAQSGADQIAKLKKQVAALTAERDGLANEVKQRDTQISVLRADLDSTKVKLAQATKPAATPVATCNDGPLSRLDTLEAGRPWTALSDQIRLRVRTATEGDLSGKWAAFYSNIPEIDKKVFEIGGEVRLTLNSCVYVLRVVDIEVGRSVTFEFFRL